LREYFRFTAQQFSCQFALIRGKKNRTSALPQPQFSKSIKTHLFPTTFNQNTIRIVQNHTKTTLLFDRIHQNLFLFAFLRCCQITLIQRTYATPFRAKSAYLRDPYLAYSMQRTSRNRVIFTSPG
jgi:hypothetical protein